MNGGRRAVNFSLGRHTSVIFNDDWATDSCSVKFLNDSCGQKRDTLHGGLGGVSQPPAACCMLAVKVPRRDRIGVLHAGEQDRTEGNWRATTASLYVRPSVGCAFCIRHGDLLPGGGQT